MKEETRVEKIFTKLSEKYPDAHCELKHNTPFQLLVAVVLSAQTTDKSVNKALEPLFAKQPLFGPDDLVKMGELKFKEIIKSIGLANTKAKNSFLLAKKIISDFQGEVPNNRDALESLPGVGRKTANVVLNVIFGMPTMAVDTHVARLAVRMGLVKPTNDRIKIEEGLLKIVPQKFAIQAHHLLIFHGRYHCMARAPLCDSCPVESLCPKKGVIRKKSTDNIKVQKKVRD